jgi:hypothetical protein
MRCLRRRHWNMHVSGRVRVQHDDGHVTTGYRKTDRRNPRRAYVTPTYQRPTLRLAFILPHNLIGFVAPGCHGVGVEVLPGGSVSVRRQTFNRSDIFEMVANFLRDITPKGALPYKFAANLTSSSEPASWQMHWQIAYADGATFAAITATEPLIFPQPV